MQRTDWMLFIAGTSAGVGSLVWLGVFFAGRVLAAPPLDPESAALRQVQNKSELASGELRALEDRFDELSDRLAELERTPKAAAAPSKVDGDLLAKLEQLQARIDELEDEITRTMHRRGPASSEDAEAQARELVDSEVARDAIANYQAAFADPARDVDVRMSALRMLRLFPDSMNARDALVVDTALGMFRGGLEARVQARLISELDGVHDERLVAPYLDALAAGETDAVRSEAAEALETFVDRADVRAALQQALTVDPSDRVRRDAARSNEHWKP